MKNPLLKNSDRTPSNQVGSPLAVERGRDNQKRGGQGEAIAALFLESKGAKILHRNWRPQGFGLRGEVDLIAEVGEFICFVEVKTRVSSAFGEPQEAVNETKQRQLGRLANAFLTQYSLWEQSCRFDILELWLEDGKKPRVVWLQNAFEIRF